MAIEDIACPGHVSQGLYDANTELLTSKGWLRFSDVRESAIVATLNPNNQHLEYHQISAPVAQFTHNGRLLRYRGQGVDLLIRPEHPLYIGNRLKVPNAKWRLACAGAIRNPFFRMKKNSEWGGAPADAHVIGEHSIPMDLWVEFLGYFVSEGYCSNFRFLRASRVRTRMRNGTQKIRTEPARMQDSYTVGITQRKLGPAAIMGAALARMPFSFCHSEGYGWTTSNKALFLELSQLGRQPQRRLPDYVRFLGRRQSRVLLDALILGDGTRGAQTCYYTSSSILAGDVAGTGFARGICGRRSLR